jgi:hypothetical protein
LDGYDGPCRRFQSPTIATGGTETDRIVQDGAVTPRLRFPSAADLTVDDRFE